MIAAGGDYRAGVVVGLFFGSALVTVLWAAAAGARRDRPARLQRQKIDALTRVHQTRSSWPESLLKGGVHGHGRASEYPPAPAARRPYDRQGVR